MKKLTIAGKTGERCACGADVYSYYQTGPYPPHKPQVPREAWVWYWYLVCEWGHEQPLERNEA